MTYQIQQGESYAFRYRGINKVGPGAFSDLVIVQAATKPAAPPAPVYVSSTSTSITLSLSETANNNGNKILSYILTRDEGDLQSSISTEVDSYNGQDSQCEVTGLTAGLVYRFAYQAVNEFGASIQSEVLTVAASALPDAPVSLQVDWSKSSKTSLWIDWS